MADRQRGDRTGDEIDLERTLQPRRNYRDLTRHELTAAAFAYGRAEADFDDPLQAAMADEPEVADVTAREMHPCPCCGYLVFDEPGSDEFCPICTWQDDIARLRFASLAGGENKLSLLEGQQLYLTTGNSDPRQRLPGRRPRAGDVRDPTWRVLEESDIEVQQPGIDEGTSYPAKPANLYYWRPEYFRRKA